MEDNTNSPISPSVLGPTRSVDADTWEPVPPGVLAAAHRSLADIRADIDAGEEESPVWKVTADEFSSALARWAAAPEELRAVAGEAAAILGVAADVAWGEHLCDWAFVTVTPLLEERVQTVFIDHLDPLLSVAFQGNVDRVVDRLKPWAWLAKVTLPQRP